MNWTLNGPQGWDGQMRGKNPRTGVHVVFAQGRHGGQVDMSSRGMVHPDNI